MRRSTIYSSLHRNRQRSHFHIRARRQGRSSRSRCRHIPRRGTIRSSNFQRRRISRRSFSAPLSTTRALLSFRGSIPFLRFRLYGMSYILPSIRFQEFSYTFSSPYILCIIYRFYFFGRMIFTDDGAISTRGSFTSIISPSKLRLVLSFVIIFTDLHFVE